jgi:hypothetical protein
MELPQLFPTHIRTWFDQFCASETVLPQLNGHASKYRKAPPVTPQRFALPHETGPIFRDTQYADRLPRLSKATVRDATPNNEDDVEVWALYAVTQIP